MTEQEHLHSGRLLHNDKKIYLFLLVVMGVGLVFRIYSASDPFLHPWDERFHALVAKNMIAHPFKPTLYEHPVMPYHYIDWDANHIWLHKQPMALWLISGSLSVFGISEMAVRLPSIILSTLSIYLVFLIGKTLFSRKTGLAAACLMAVNGLLIDLTGAHLPTDHIDVTFQFFILLAIALAALFARTTKPVYNVLTGICIGLAILSKWLPALIVFPVWILLVADSGKFSLRKIAGHFLVMAVLTFAVFLPWQWYTFRYFPLEARWEFDYNHRHLNETLEGITFPFFFYIKRLLIDISVVFFVPLAWFTYRTLRNFRHINYRDLALLVWFYVPLLVFTMASTKMPGYILFTFPAILLMCCEFAFMLADKIRSGRFVIAGWALILAMVISPLWRLYRSAGVSGMTPSSVPAWITGLKAHDRPGAVLFNYPRPVEAMFYTSMTVYPYLPDQATLQKLVEDKYEVIICDDGRLPAGLDGIKGVSLHRYSLPED